MKTQFAVTLFCTLILLMSATLEHGEDKIIISGKITNPKSDSIIIRDKNRITVYKIKLTAENEFRDTLQLAEGYYSIKHGRENTQVYLKPGFDFVMTIDTKKFDESIKYAGRGANENNYLAQKSLLEESFGDLNYYGYYGKLEENKFLSLADSLQGIVMKLFNTGKKGFDGNFIFLESNSLKYALLNKKANYKGQHRFLTNMNDFQVSSRYPNILNQIDLDDDRLINCPFYISCIESCLFQSAHDRIKQDSSDYYITYLQLLETKVANPKIKEIIAYNTGKYYLTYTHELDKVYQAIISMMTNATLKEEVTINYLRLKKVQKGASSPMFSLDDINGKNISLESLSGKIIYIDIWATWCLPCVQEIPHLQELEKTLKGKNIQFVSISKGDYRDRWEAMVKEKQLGGIQLFAPDDQIAFFKDYMVDGIPRFIILDKDLKIIDANAKKPSDPRLKEELLKLL